MSRDAGRTELILYALVLTGLHWLCLAFQLPLAQSLRGWFWPYAGSELRHTWLIPLLAIASFGVARYAQRHACSPMRVLAPMVALGFGLQLGVAHLEGNGPRALEESLTRSGHWRIAQIAAGQDGFLEAARSFEKILTETPDTGFLQSKPPGYLLFYMLSMELAWGIDAPDSAEARLARFSAVAGVGWALLCALGLIPVFWLARLLVEETGVWQVCLAYALVPALLLINGHLDLVLFPLLSASCLAIAGHACRLDHPPLAFAAGAAIALCLFVSFSLIPLPLLVVGVAAACLWKRGATARSVGRLAACAAAGAVSVQALLAIGIGYDVHARWEHAFHVHTIWKQLASGTRPVLYAMVLNGIELAWWWGVPLVAAWMLAIGSACARAITRSLEPVDSLALSSLAVLLGLGLLGRTLAEVGRLWAFLLPVVCLLAIDQIGRRFGPRATPVAAGLLVLQFTTALLLKRYADLFTLASPR